MGKGGDNPHFARPEPEAETYRVARSVEGTKIVEAKFRPVPPEGPVLVGVRGNWYDITKYVPNHPGGDILLEFAGRDATAQFVAYHSDKVLKHWKPVGSYKCAAMLAQNTLAPGAPRPRRRCRALRPPPRPHLLPPAPATQVEPRGSRRRRLRGRLAHPERHV